MKKGLTLLTLLLSATVAFSSCGKKEEEQSKVENKAPKPLTELAQENKGPHGQMPPGHPPMEGLPEGHPPINNMPPGHPGHSSNNLEKELAAMHPGKNMTKIDKPIKIPEEVIKTWKYATIEVVDKTTGKVVKKEKVTKDSDVKFQDLEIKVLYIVPHLVYDQQYTSGSNEPNNPAVIVEVKSNGKVIYAGPIYQKFPTMYNIKHPKYELKLVAISKS
ncbi:hypothetical protein Dester_1010 [Desulfurobacterium thermolithotrophum DSM 11699]|uniref:Lipoprotein n=1 Tax=Desulfurobacterium thermolithotrophum (strain DSM 11699 / BSA) TaxID=868864 RepID=F0S477_DESTD|nr:DUF2155 domain-containing protein [Desulfurobacterium thermolithotrophum]ADY73649.1 hypothetical protein Dester_1010 [Desulfurobacterium thermolithotrophum DSM 11699]